MRRFQALPFYLERGVRRERRLIAVLYILITLPKNNTVRTIARSRSEVALPHFVFPTSHAIIVVHRTGIDMQTKGNDVGVSSLDLILKGFRHILGKNAETLTDNAEFMGLIELHFLVKK